MAPQDLPASRTLLLLTVMSYGLVNSVLYIAEMPVLKAILAAATELGLMALLSYVLLWIRLLSNRWLQTLTALMGTGAVLAVLVLPFWFWQAGVSQSAVAVIPALVILGFMVWNLIVVAHILRHALTIPFVLGGTFSAVYMYIAWRVMSLLFFSEPR
jgi:hypothetical protein